MKITEKTICGVSFLRRIKAVATALLLCGAFIGATAQTVDGRDFSIDGFAAIAGTPGTNHYLAGGTTGGAGGKVVYAATLSQLQAYLQAKDPYIVIVDKDMVSPVKCYVDALATGNLCEKQDGSEGVESTYGERILIASNKTLIGVVNKETGMAPLFTRITFVMQCASNVIIRNCRFTMNGVPVFKSDENKIAGFHNGAVVNNGDPDCIGIQADKKSAKTDWGAHIWIDHCEFFNGNASNKNRYDGLLDCKNNVQWMTFSYNYFHNHDKTGLFGKGGSDVYENCRTITMHHNHYENIDGSRLPLQRGGHLHYLNNYQNNCSKADGWCLQDGAVGYVEGCYFKNTKAPIQTDKGNLELNINKEDGYDIYYVNCRRLLDGYSNADGSKIDQVYQLYPSTWTPEQTASEYKVNHKDKTADVPEIVTKYAGAGKIEIYKAYTDEIPAENINEYANAVKNALTGSTYDENGNKITEVTTGIGQIAAGNNAVTEYYNVNGTRLALPAKGINIRKTVDNAGNVNIQKIIIK